MSAKSGLSFDVQQFKRIMAQKKKRVTAASFRPQMREFVSKSLSRAAATCPVRDLALIQANQAAQYENRVNYIPSIHWPDADPRMVVNDTGEKWVFCGGKWYNASAWKLPPAVFGAYQELNAERERRLQTPEGAFIAHRAQARWLYVKQFWLMARALGVRAIIAGAAIASRSRRQPPKEPTHPNARWQGGKDTLSAVVTAPFLSTPTAYWEGNGLEILRSASDAERPAFTNAVRNEMIKRITE